MNYQSSSDMSMVRAGLVEEDLVEVDLAGLMAMIQQAMYQLGPI